jgi:hypothetical protein
MTTTFTMKSYPPEFFDLSKLPQAAPAAAPVAPPPPKKWYRINQYLGEKTHKVMLDWAKDIEQKTIETAALAKKIETDPTLDATSANVILDQIKDNVGKCRRALRTMRGEDFRCDYEHEELIKQLDAGLALVVVDILRAIAPYRLKY